MTKDTAVTAVQQHTAAPACDAHELRLQELFKLAQQQQETQPGPGHYQVGPKTAAAVPMCAEHERTWSTLHTTAKFTRSAIRLLVPQHIYCCTALYCRPYLPLPSATGVPAGPTHSPWMGPSPCTLARPAHGPTSWTVCCCSRTLA
jgi:hypothetical protein